MLSLQYLAFDEQGHAALHLIMRELHGFNPFAIGYFRLYTEAYLYRITF